VLEVLNLRQEQDHKKELNNEFYAT
jgi:hypothetical protein